MLATNQLPDLKADASKSVAQVASKIPEPPYKMSGNEKKIWHYVTSTLHEYGLVHSTDGLLLSIIAKTFAAWMDAEDELAKFSKENSGTYMVTTPNGYKQPHQIYYLAKNLKRELLQWLPEAALTIPSFQKSISALGAPDQGSLFGDDPAISHRNNKTKIGMVLVNGGKG